MMKYSALLGNQNLLWKKSDPLPFLSYWNLQRCYPKTLQQFPHDNASRIDVRTVTKGDLVTYPDPFASVDLKYIGYKYLRETNKWTEFTISDHASKVFETRLGNYENIIGLEQAVLSMTKGEVVRVWIPSRLGYGVHGAEPLIPPNTDLVL
eukprot:1066919_1